MFDSINCYRRGAGSPSKRRLELHALDDVIINILSHLTRVHDTKSRRRIALLSQINFSDTTPCGNKNDDRNRRPAAAPTALAAVAHRLASQRRPRGRQPAPTSDGHGPY